MSGQGEALPSGSGPLPPPPPPPSATVLSRTSVSAGPSTSLEEQLKGTKISSWRSDSFAPQSETGLVGLCNQGATCYMNSLLQSLYMTPDFRAALYSWSYDEEIDGPQESCIPLQLQRLFARLGMSKCAYIETKNLTTSFGWTGREVFEQHDVQELCRVLFEAIDKSFHARGMSSPISPLYQGVLQDYLRCTICNFARLRPDPFMDIQLVIRGLTSLEEALTMYITPELLNGGNQWYCEKCDKKVDALKGLKLKDLPPLLVLQLKRFDFNYETMNRIKLNNQLSFPFYLNMSPYIKGDLTPVPSSSSASSSSPDSMVLEEQWPCALCTYLNTSDLLCCEMCNTPRPATTTTTPETETSNATNQLHNEQDSALRGNQPTGPAATERYVPTTRPVVEDSDTYYELYSVLIHSGGAMGGHYFAYIKDLESGTWFNFNDTKVTQITEEDVTKMYGDSEKRLSASNAYLLMYRRMEPNQDYTTESDATCTSSSARTTRKELHIPPSILAEVEEENKKYEEDRQEFERKLNTLHLRVFYGDKPLSVSVLKTQTIRELTEEAWKEAKLQDYLPQSCVRLRNYNPTTGTIGPSFQGKEDVTLAALSVYTQKAFFLETKDSIEMEWPKEDFGALVLLISKLNDEQELEPAVALSFPNDSNASLASLRDAIAQHEKLAIPQALQRIARIRGSTVIFLEGDGSQLLVKDMGILDGTLLYVERVVEGGELEEYSFIKARFEEEKNLIELELLLPEEVRLRMDDSSKEQQHLEAEEQEERTDGGMTLVFDQRKTIGELKSKIASMTGIPRGELRLKRKLLSKEIKDESASLQANSLFDGSAIIVEQGTPLTVGQIICQVYLLTTAPTALLQEDDGVQRALMEEDEIIGEDADIVVHHMHNETVNYELICNDQTINEHNTGKDLKIIVKDRLVELGHGYEGGVEVSLDRIRIRERLGGSRLGKILRNTRTLKESLPSIRDGQELVVQIIPKEMESREREMKDSDILLDLRRFHPANYTVDSPEEMLLNKNCTVLALRQLIAQTYNVPVDNIYIAKPFSFQLIQNEGVTHADEEAMNWEIMDDRVLGRSPLYLRDGDMLLWKDAREIKGDIDPSELALKMPVRRMPKETGIVIRTIHDTPKDTSAAETENSS